MIYDSISNLYKYRGISKNLDTAIDFIIQTDLSSLPIGCTEVDSTNVFVNVMEAKARSRDEMDFEIHNKYIDIQIDLVGKELIEIGIGELKELIPIEDNKDIGFFEAEDAVGFIMEAGKFIICMVGEPHKSGIKVSELVEFKKCVVKVAR